MADKEVLVIASKVKAYIKSKELHTSSDAIAALSDKVCHGHDKRVSIHIQGGVQIGAVWKPRRRMSITAHAHNADIVRQAKRQIISADCLRSRFGGRGVIGHRH